MLTGFFLGAFATGLLIVIVHLIFRPPPDAIRVFGDDELVTLISFRTGKSVVAKRNEDGTLDIQIGGGP